MGGDAIVSMHPAEVLRGKKCDVLSVQPSDDRTPCMFWIDRVDHRFVMVESRSTSRKEGMGIVKIVYDVIAFPKRIEHRWFSAAAGRFTDNIAE